MDLKSINKEASLLDEFFDEDFDIEDEEKEEKIKFEEQKKGEFDVFSIYFKQINNYNLITPDEEIKLFKQLRDYEKERRRLEESIKDKNINNLPEINNKIKALKDAEQSIRDQIITANLRLVVAIAKKYQNKAISLIDLINEGNIGLLEAVEKFDYKKGNKFSTYAIYWIKQSIMKALSDKSRVIRIPIYLNNLLLKINLFINNYKKENGKEPPLELLCEKFDLTKKRLIEILQLNNETNFLEEPISPEASAVVGDFLPSTNDYPDEIEFFNKEHISNILNKALSSLSAREKLILELRYGIHSNKTYTLEETGRLLSLTRERVRQIQNKALKKLKTSKFSNLLNEISENI